ncbi:MAG: hypothetical protein AABY39_01090 [Nitrospirota bacterium]
MKEPKHNNLIVYYPKVDGIWKSPEQTASEFTIYLRVKQRIVS